MPEFSSKLSEEQKGKALVMLKVLKIGTDDELKSFQSNNGLGSDGVIGKQTFAALEKTLKNLTNTPAVVTSQTDSRYPHAPDNWGVPSADVLGTIKNGSQIVYQQQSHEPKLSYGTLTVVGADRMVYHFKALTGGHGKGELPGAACGTGNDDERYKGVKTPLYTVTNFRARTDKAMTVFCGEEKIGFSCDLLVNGKDSVPGTGRTNLRIHPDGNVPGSEGCISCHPDCAKALSGVLKDLLKKNPEGVSLEILPAVGSQTAQQAVVNPPNLTAAQGQGAAKPAVRAPGQ